MLRDTIKCFWYDKIDFGERAASFEVAPDGYAEIIFHVGSVCSLFTTGGWQQLPSPFLMGLLQQPALLTTQRQLEIIGIRCFPWTVFQLLGLPSGNDRGCLAAHPIAQLQAPLAQLIQAGKPAEALTQVAQYCERSWSRLAGDRLVTKAGGALREAYGALPVSQVAAAANATVRTLERNFKQAAGCTVKDVARLMRFERVRNHLRAYPETPIASLAYELGYTDHSHLSREFKRYSGLTPKAFAGRARGAKAAISPDFVAFIQA